MPFDQTTHRSAAGLRQHLRELDSELAHARELGLGGNETYMAHLAHDVALAKAAYVGAAVTEIASLRAAIDGPLLG